MARSVLGYRIFLIATSADFLFLSIYRMMNCGIVQTVVVNHVINKMTN